MPERDHHPATGATNGLRRRHDRLRVAECFAHGPATGFVPDRTVFQFAVFTNDGALAIGLYMTGAAQGMDQLLGQLRAQPS
ncbi:hypothetical protein D3C81_2231480 [compost metagenome]